MQESSKIANDYWSEGGYSMPSLLDPQNDLRRKYEVSIQPTTIFLNADGDMTSRKDGPLDGPELTENVQKMLSSYMELGDQPKVPEHKNDVRVSERPSLLSSWYEGEVKHSINLNDILSGGPGKDGIPAINDPQFLPLSEIEYLKDFDLGILLSINNDTRYYPYKILNWHEIVNDTVGGEDVFITYCPLCATGVTYSRDISKGVVEFGVSGFLSQSNLLMYDRATDSLWNQVTGEAVVGPLTGEKLKFVRSDVVPWGIVKASYRDATVLSIDTGYSRDYTSDPYAGYDARQQIMFPVTATDGRLENKDLIYGIVVNGKAKAYQEEDLRIAEFIDDAVGGAEISVSFEMKKEELIVTKKSNGEIVPAMPSFWFAWVAQYPETELYK